jgi:uncharacterized membrane protein YfcA
VGVALGLPVGYISSLLGIGGGIIHVPALAYFLNFPVLIVTATSHFILAIMTFYRNIGPYHIRYFQSWPSQNYFLLAAGVLLGAQLGAFLSNRVQGVWIIRGLAIALILVGIRILIMAL